MENSEIQKEVINLGKQFVKELNLERGSNTLPRWMAHYLAEKIKQAESLQGSEKEQAEKECFKIVLKLWKHRWRLPHGRRPFEKFESILNLLHQIDPANKEPYYFPRLPANHRDDTDVPEEGTVEFWVRIAEQIDKVARIWICDILKIAADAAKDDSTADWLRNAVNLPESHDRNIIDILLSKHHLDSNENINEEFEEKFNAEMLKSRIEELEHYSKLNEFLLQRYKSELLKAKSIGGSDDTQTV